MNLKKLLFSTCRTIADIVVSFIDILYIIRKHSKKTVFYLSPAQQQRIAKWQQAENGECMLIVNSSPLGMQIKAKSQLTNAEIDLTDYNLW